MNCEDCKHLLEVHEKEPNDPPPVQCEACGHWYWSYPFMVELHNSCVRYKALAAGVPLA